MAKTAVSGFAAKLGKAGLEAFEELKDEEIVVGSAGECPPIPNGVAQLTDIHLGEYKTGKNQGKPFAYLGAVVISPEYVLDGEGSKLKAAGTQTNQTIPLCETVNRKGEVKTFKQNYGEFLNALKKLGLDTKGMSGTALDAAIAALVASKPYFVFNVTVSAPTPEFPNPSKFHNWGLADPNYEDKTDPDAGVVESNGSAPAAKKTATTTKPASTPTAKKGLKKTEPVEDVPFGDDLDMTADKADADDEAAKTWLGNRALELGYTEEEIENAGESWSDVAQLIRDKEAEGEGEAETEEEATEDAVDYDALGELADAEDAEAIETIKAWATEYGEDPDDHGDKTWAEFVTYIKENYEAAEEEEVEELVPEKNGVYEAIIGKSKKPVQIEVLVVKTKEKLVNVKNLDNGKIEKDIPWASLSEVS